LYTKVKFFNALLDLAIVVSRAKHLHGINITSEPITSFGHNGNVFVSTPWTFPKQTFLFMLFIKLVLSTHYSLLEFSQSLLNCTWLAWMTPMITHITNVVTQLILMDNVVCPHQIQCKPQLVWLDMVYTTSVLILHWFDKE
jgi:hypothetical protein